MKTKEPKALVPFLGVPVLEYMLKSVAHMFPRPYIVIGHRGEEIRQHLGEHFNYIYQDEALGTGHAVIAAQEKMADKKLLQNIVIVPGDHPLITTESLRAVIETHTYSEAILTVATARVPHYEGIYRHFYDQGRIIKDDWGQIQRIVELKDCTEEEKAITEVNVSYYCFDSDWLWAHIHEVDKRNAAGEYYLTDMVGLTVARHPKKVAVHGLGDPLEGLGVNDLKELRDVENFVTKSALCDTRVLDSTP